MLDTPQQIQQLAPKIQAQAGPQIMPLGNITQMTQEERNLIGSWIAKGAQDQLSLSKGEEPHLRFPQQNNPAGLYPQKPLQRAFGHNWP